MISRILLATLLALSACGTRLSADAPIDSILARAGARAAVSTDARTAERWADVTRVFADLPKLLLPSSHDVGYAFIHHKLVGLSAPTGSPPSSWSNTKSCRYGGTATASAGRTNWGQPTAWCTNPAANAYTFSFWFRRNGDDGSLLASADQSTNSHMRVGVAGTAIANVYAGGNFVTAGSCGTTITNATWYLLTWVYDGAGNLNVYVGNSSTACITYVSVGTQTCTRDFIFNTLRSTTNADTAFGEWGLHNLDEFTVWNTALTGTDHVNLQSSGHAVDPMTHSKAANLIDYYRCGDDPADSSTTLYDQIGSWDGTHSGSDGVTYPSDVP